MNCPSLKPVFLAMIAIAIVAHMLPVAADSTQQDVPGIAAGDGAVADESRSEEREAARRLRRARAQHEAARAESRRQREAEQARHSEITRLHSGVSDLERRESFLRHEAREARLQLDATPTDPVNHPAMVQRGELERRLVDQRMELHRTMTSRDDAVRRLDALRLR